ncbi:MAG: FAD-binding oxidoreductase [Bacilli bacterium]|nr:FAD-binding oxidoreductase [Bacilli bacterium]
MKNNSIWEEEKTHEFPSLKENINTDILIIGGGIAGILTALNLMNSNLKITLVERNKILHGVSSKMTAKVTILQDILTKISDNKKGKYLKSQLAGLKLIKDNIEKLDIKCDFIKNESYLFTSKYSNIEKLERIEKELDKLKINYDNSSIPIKELKSLYSVKINDSYSINIIKYLNNIVDNLKNINIYENTNIIKVIKDNGNFIAKTNKYKINAKKIIFASHYPYFIKPLLFPLKVRLEKSSIMYGESFYHGNYNLINIDNDVHSIRFYKDKMIYLCNSKYISHISDDKVNNFLIKKVDNTWTNMDIITNDYLPLIGEIQNNIYIITGFNTWGILSSHIGASMLSNLILKKNAYLEYINLFDPRRNISMQKVVNSSINVLENMNGYFKGMVTKSMKCTL